MPDFSDFREIQISTPWGRVLDEFASFCQPKASSWSLDIGCGPGLLPALFSKRGCVSLGVDLDLKLLQARLATGLVQADAYRLPFGNDTYHLITATNVLFLMPEPIAIIQECARTMKPHGRLCLLNPSEKLSIEAAERLAEKRGLQGKAKDSLIAWAANAESHYLWTVMETASLLESAGLELVEFKLSVGPGFALFSRAEKRR